MIQEQKESIHTDLTIPGKTEFKYIRGGMYEMRFSEFDEVREISELRTVKENGSDKKSSNPVTQKLGLIKTMSPEALALKLRKEVKK